MDRTKKYKISYRLCSIVSVLLSFAPILIYGIISYGIGTTKTKFVLSIGFILALVLAVLGFLTKVRFKSALWVVLLGISLALEKIQIMLLIVALCSLLDELIMEPLTKRYKNIYIINSEIDKRQ